MYIVSDTTLPGVSSAGRRGGAERMLRGNSRWSNSKSSGSWRSLGLDEEISDGKNMGHSPNFKKVLGWGFSMNFLYMYITGL